MEQHAKLHVELDVKARVQKRVDPDARVLVLDALLHVNKTALADALLYVARIVIQYAFLHVRAFVINHAKVHARLDAKALVLRHVPKRAQNNVRRYAVKFAQQTAIVNALENATQHAADRAEIPVQVIAKQLVLVHALMLDAWVFVIINAAMHARLVELHALKLVLIHALTVVVVIALIPVHIHAKFRLVKLQLINKCVLIIYRRWHSLCQRLNAMVGIRHVQCYAKKNALVNAMVHAVIYA